ncbi:TetR/AcrR family transcriptional regulator [Colwellia asteriadis]|uniref:TetR/AcrR family transcriptional regulator n=1 Tax=Colwellia asteriadis TaxID=517723 RepID=A0ABN1L9X7_9GAMM
MSSGRQRSFCKKAALEKAMIVFWCNGYSGTSLADLTEAMGINKSSLYAAFGNKEALFNQVLDFYLELHGSSHSRHLFEQQHTLQERLKNYLSSIARMLTDANLPKGCLICSSTSELAGSCLPEKSSQIIAMINRKTVDFLTEFLKNEQKEQHLTADCDINKIANYLLTLQFGLAVSARNGSELAELLAVIDRAIECFNNTISL